jgi:hypothetical protein
MGGGRGIFCDLRHQIQFSEEIMKCEIFDCCSDAIPLSSTKASELGSTDATNLHNERLLEEDGWYCCIYAYSLV